MPRRDAPTAPEPADPFFDPLEPLDAPLDEPLPDLPEEPPLAVDDLPLLEDTDEPMPPPWPPDDPLEPPEWEDAGDEEVGPEAAADSREDEP